ncbi:cytochrome P450 [Crucibulum laeve]|uniref:Cytochrome P450 n=1 Tax=Crucibulum laeve TaxID=68775 RepID=A0A5C3M931_9AGAR|nr:cytochrome P450 [Crucibulum laeve]
MPALWADIVACIVALALYLHIRRVRSYRHLPPGPRKLPFIGNLLDIPTSLEWEVYARWGKEFNSPLLHLDVGGSTLIVINSAKIAIDLLEKRSSIYSDRPDFPMLVDLMGYGWMMSAMHYGEPWKERRRLLQRHFHPSNADVHESKEVEFTHKFLVRLLDSPERFLGHIRHMAGGVTLSLAFGLDIDPDDDPYVKLAAEAVGTLTEAAIPGAFFVDVFPFLKYMPSSLPGAGFQKKAQVWRKQMETFHEEPFAAALRKIASGTAEPSFTSLCMDVISEAKNPEQQMSAVKDTAGMFYAAGADTTVSSIDTFFIAMVYYPEVQLAAQRELDAIVGRSRLPDFTDRPHLPYVTALMKEILRWQPVTPQGVPRRVMEDDIYENYQFPAGTVFIPNAWAMLHDEEEYPDSLTFKPERFLKDGKLNPEVRDPASLAFGFGRRACPGSHIAQSTMWLTFASILSTFDVTAAVDKNGAKILPQLFYKSSIVSHPLPFQCTIKPRSSIAERVIRDTLMTH